MKRIGTDKSTYLNLGEDVTGHIAIAEWIKSKSNSKKRTCQLAYTNEAGYDPMLSNIYNAKEIGDLKQSGANLYIPGYEDFKFTLKTYKDKFADSPEMISRFVDFLRDRCSVMLDNPNNAKKNNDKMIEQAREDLHNSFEDEFGSSAAVRAEIMDIDDMLLMAVNS